MEIKHILIYVSINPNITKIDLYKKITNRSNLNNRKYTL